MKKILFFICILFTVGCTSSDSINHSSSYYLDDIEFGHKIANIDSCEYIYFHLTDNYGEGVFTHKGNCNNPIHKCSCK